MAIGRAVVVALPLILGFGALFVAADAVFEAQFRRLTRFDFESLWSHAVWFAACGWTAAGVFWCGLVIEAPDAPEAELPEHRRLRALETGVILGSLAALFAAFVAIQIRYLFGGEGLVQESLNLTYAEYARRGFFELVAASALLLPVLLMVNWTRRRGRLSDRVYQLMTFILVGLLLIIMASALQRLRIYEQAFGLTELRLYSATFLVGLGALFLWLLWTLVRQGGNGFVCGALVAAVVTLVGLNAMNPDALIATRNTDRSSSGARFDAAHALRLSADAVPALVRRLDLLSPSDRCLVARMLLERWSGEPEDFRSWNWGRQQARDVVSAYRNELEAACGG